MMGVWSAIPAFALQLWGCQRVLRGAISSGLLLCWAGWIACGLLLPGAYSKLGALNFLVGALLVALPLSLETRSGFSRRWLILLGFLAFCGCLPFSTFSAYFQTFVPLMSVGEGVPDMKSRLFTAEGLLASLAMLCVVYQTGALGYFYWSRVLRAAPSGRPGGWTTAWLRAGLAASATLGLMPRAYARALQGLAAFLGMEAW